MCYTPRGCLPRHFRVVKGSGERSQEHVGPSLRRHRCTPNARQASKSSGFEQTTRHRTRGPHSRGDLFAPRPLGRFSSNRIWVIRYFTSCTRQKERDWQSRVSSNIGLSFSDNGEALYASLNAARAAKSGI